jgi:hypothetical protein
VDAVNGHVWRVTYRQSNSAEDMVITSLPASSPHTLTALRRQGLERVAGGLSWLFAPLAALAVWLGVWRYVMRKLLNVDYQWRDRRLWVEALGWALLYPLTNGVILLAGVMLTALTVGVALVIAGPMLLIAALAGISIFFFARNRAKALGVPRGRAAMAYITAMVMANAIFLGFGIFYLSLLGA